MSYLCDVIFYPAILFNRPGVAGAVLQTPFLIKGGVGNAILDTKGKIVLALF